MNEETKFVKRIEKYFKEDPVAILLFPLVITFSAILTSMWLGDFEIIADISKLCITISGIIIGFGFMLFSNFYGIKMHTLSEYEINMVGYVRKMMLRFIYVIIISFITLILTKIPLELGILLISLSYKSVILYVSSIIMFCSLIMAFSSLMRILNYPKELYREQLNKI